MAETFTPVHRGGSGEPMVCLHGFTDTWRTWELVLGALEREHDVLAPTLSGHAAGPPLPPGADETAGGWAADDDSWSETLAYFTTMQELLRNAALYADEIVSTVEGRRRATLMTAERFEHIPAELLAHQIRGAAACPAVAPLVDHAARRGWTLDAERIDCPVRIVWGTEDRLLRWPGAAARFREEWTPHAQLILGFTRRESASPARAG